MNRKMIGSAHAITDEGEVLSFLQGRGNAPINYDNPHALKLSTNNSGYRTVSLSRYDSRLVHRLVAEAFLGEFKEDGLEVAHLDGNKLNNSVGNLAWVTKIENESHKEHHGTKIAGELNYNSVLTDELVLLARKMRANGKSFVDIAKDLGVARGNLRKAIIGETWKHLPGGVS